MVYGTMIMEDDHKGGGGHDEDDDDGYDDQYGTMIMANGGGGKGGGNDLYDNEEDDDGDYDNDQYGTMIYDELPTQNGGTQDDEIKSLFEDSNRINSVIELPEYPTRQELEDLSGELQEMFQKDLEKMNSYYNTNIAFVQKRINEMD